VAQFLVMTVGRCPRRLSAVVAIALCASATALAAQSDEVRRGPFTTRPAVAGTLGVMLPMGSLADRYEMGPTFKGAVHLPLVRSLIFVGEFSYTRLPLRRVSADPNFIVRDGTLIGGSGHVIVPVGSRRLPVPGLGRGAPYVIGGVGLFHFERETRTESYRPGFTGGMGLSFDAPGHARGVHRGAGDDAGPDRADWRPGAADGGVSVVRQG
jgi:hypothetical protein